MSTMDGTMTDAILESISDGVFTVDPSWRITSFNRAAEEITGVSREAAIGSYCSEVFRSSMCGANCPLRRTMETGKPVIGQSGYIIDSEGNRIPISISTALLKSATGEILGGAETFRDLTEIETLRNEIEGRYRIGELVSRSPAMQRVFEILPAVASSPSTVLITGETGTGKEVLARTIHGESPRKDGPFVAVNCGALPDTLLESELFGYKAGAFTGASKDKPGRFALAAGGTIFLDEIGEISPALQVRFLRVLQERTFEPLGGTRPEKADIRVIVATNRNLAEAMKNGDFREDLFYRVNVVRIDLPPLRDRQEDLPLLADHFIRRFNALQDRAIRGISAEALSLLMAHRWPGNVRELENVIERSFIMCNTDTIGIAHLPDELTSFALPGTTIRSADTVHDLFDVQSIRAALERNHDNRAATARDLGIHKTTLYRRMKRLGMRLPAPDGRGAAK